MVSIHADLQMDKNVIPFHLFGFGYFSHLSSVLGTRQLISKTSLDWKLWEFTQDKEVNKLVKEQDFFLLFNEKLSSSTGLRLS